MKRFLTALVLFFCVFHLSAQDKEIKIITEYNENRNRLDIKAEKEIPGTFFVEMTFTTLQNTKFKKKTHTTTITDSKTILSIAPEDESKYFEAYYTYRYWLGNPAAEPNQNFVYRLPYGTHKEKKAESIQVGVNSILSHKKWQGIHFSTHQGDTIYAARSGIVVNANEKKTTIKKQTHKSANFEIQTISQNDAGEVTVEHNDGSYAGYYVFDEIFVTPGEIVYPDTPIGITGSIDNKNYETNVFFFYTRIASKTGKNSKTEIDHLFFMPIFATSKGEMELTMGKFYTPVVTTELITKEMTKKQAKAYQKK